MSSPITIDREERLGINFNEPFAARLGLYRYVRANWTDGFGTQ
jgi:hypothetical protein